MRILMLDLDTLRPDHLGCYGYWRNTSPVIDSVARDSLRFNEYYCSMLHVCHHGLHCFQAALEFIMVLTIMEGRR